MKIQYIRVEDYYIPDLTLSYFSWQNVMLGRIIHHFYAMINVNA